MKNVFLTSLFYIVIASCYSQGYIIENYDITIELSPKGHYDISEQITVEFIEERRGIIRDVPKHYSINGKNKRIRLSNVNVDRWHYKILYENGASRIRIGKEDKYLTGRQVYNISYRLNNAYLHAEDHIAFQYNLIADWDTEIKNVSYKITVPAGINLSQDDYVIMTGADGEHKRHVSLTKIGNVLKGRSLTSIPAYENVTIAIKLPADYIEKPIPPFSVEAAQKDKSWLYPLLLSLIGFFFYRNKSKELPDGPFEDQYYPPDMLSPALVGAYHDNKIQTEDLISLLPHWANKGYIKIIGTDSTISFKKENDLPSDTPMYQSIIFEKIFEDGSFVTLVDLKHQMSSLLLQSKGELKKELVSQGYYDEYNYRLFHSGWLIAIAVLAIGGAIYFGIQGMPFLSITLVLMAILSFIIHSREPKLSPSGIVIKRHLKGLKRFLMESNPHKTRELIRDNPNYFENLFPYAIAFGIDKTWTEKMDAMNITPPYWYYTDNSGIHSRPSFSTFNKQFDVNKISSVFSTPPPSSSGSSGGGFGSGAGGGVGGGGSSW